MRCKSIASISEDDRRRTTAIDLLEWYEEKVLTELVRRVYKTGMVGETWPVIERIPMRMQDGELVRCGPQDVTEWRIVASVEAEPR